MQKSQLKSLASNLVAMAATLGVTYLVTFFVVASYVATDNGPIRWDQGLVALQELLWNR